MTGSIAEISIKRIGIDEAHLVIDLFDKYRVFYKKESDLVLAARFITERLGNNESVIFVALVNNQPAGFTQLYPKYSSARAVKNWILNDLYVDKDYRKKGIGNQLITAAADFATDNGAVFIQLETAVDNANAQRLYESMGFVKQGPDEEYFLYKLSLN